MEPLDSSTEVVQTGRPFENIPVEILLHICSFLDGRFISETLAHVCQRFYNILNDDSVWKRRISKMHNNRKYPALLVNDEDFDWKEACIEIEHQQGLWMNKASVRLKYFKWNDVHYAAVDAIHLVNDGQVCVTGGRDRSIVAWNLSDIRDADSESHRPVYQLCAKAHQGWIWNLASHKERLYSCSWDTYVNEWDVSANLHKTNYFKCENAVLSIAVDRTTLAAGLYNSNIVLFDARSQDPRVSLYSPHRRSILALAICDKYIVSASEDQTLAVWDRAAGKVLKDKIALVPLEKEGIVAEEGVAPKKVFPMCLSYKNNQLYVGDSKGKLHLIDPVFGRFVCIKTYDVGHEGKLTSIEQGCGHLITGSTDGSINVLTPTDGPNNMTTLQSAGGEVTGVAYQDDILVTSGTNCSVEVWIPNAAT